MANPLLLHENILADTTGTLSTSVAAAAGFPLTNINDWRMGTTYRFKLSATSGFFIDMDAGVGNTLEADTVAIGGHNMFTNTASISVLADAAIDPPTTARLAAVAPPDNLPFLRTFTSPGAVRYWRIGITAVSSEAPQFGIITLGRRIDYDAGALADLDPYNRSSNVEPFINNNGSPIGVNVRSKTKRFQMSYGGDGPGMRKTSFFTTVTPDIDTGWLPHAVDNAKPFWFAWNIGVDAGEVYLCRVDGPTVSMPFVGSTARRGFQTTFIAHRETS